MPWYYFVYFYSLFFHPAPQPVLQPALVSPAVVASPYVDGRRPGETAFTPGCERLGPTLTVCR